VKPDAPENAHLFSVHVVYCRGCQRRWLDPPPAPHVDCACTCSDPEDPLYEAWVVDPFMDEQSTAGTGERSTRMGDLIAFWEARLDEDEAAAKAATAGPWEFEGDDPADDELYSVHDGIVDLVGVTVAFTRDRNVANGQHMARHDPDRTIREVEAGRALIERYKRACAVRESVVSFTAGQDDGYRQACEDAIRDLAAIHGDHPDYQQEWKP